LPYRLHGADPLWAPPLRAEVRTSLSPGKDPFFDHGELQLFLAERDGAVAGRVAAITNTLHNETHGDLTGFFGFFESVEDAEVAGTLLDAAAEWCRERGHDRMLGPVSHSVNHECGLLVDGFETPNVLLMPRNPRWYADLLEGAGLRKAKDLLAFEVGTMVGTAPPIPERARRAMERIGKRQGVTLRPIRVDRLREEADRIREIFNACWAENWSFVPFTAREIREMTKRLKPVIDPELVPVAEKAGEPVGFALAVPDLNHALLRNRGGHTLPGAARILWSLWRREIPRIRILLLGILPEHRGKGIDAMLFHWVWDHAVAGGKSWAEASWILEDNAPMINALTRMGFSHYKTFRLYDRPL
jgi:GNAT superfamily N-acetyltransferase